MSQGRYKPKRAQVLAAFDERGPVDIASVNRPSEA